MPVVVDVTDVVEFWTRQESPSGVQRVIVHTVPLLAAQGARAMVLDRSRGVFVTLTEAEQRELFSFDRVTDSETSRSRRAEVSSAVLTRARQDEPLASSSEIVALFLGAVWINDALMLAARDLHAQGARCVYLLYDLTPVLETGHTDAVRRLFEAYLQLLVDTGARVPAISRASRNDFEQWCLQSNLRVPAGEGIGLPIGLDPEAFTDASNPWPRPYALMVGTIEARKNHLLAFQAWADLIAEYGAEAVPDLVCIGRLGWHSEAFLTAYRDTSGLGGKVSVLSGGVSDADLGRFYRHAQFTVYPSRYEGWGLPVSEALAFGKVTIAANNSSLPEAGGDLAIYVETDDQAGLVRAIEEFGLDRDARRAYEDRIAVARGAADATRLTWHDVADALLSECRAAVDVEVPVSFPSIELGTEYTFASAGEPPSADYADQYADYLMYSDVSPLLSQPHPQTAPAGIITGQFGSPQGWGLELHPGRRFDIRFTRPVAGELVALLATRSQPGVATVEAAGPGGPKFTEVHLGSAVTVEFGDGQAGDAALASIQVTDAADSIEGFLGVCSIVVLEKDDLTAQVAALQSAARALRQELDFIQGTRSWRITAPLRRWKGRGA